jgi:CubicO group peptidase (beta-lactamase class C family)
MYPLLSIVAVVAAIAAFIAFQFVCLDDPAANAAEPAKSDLNGARNLADILEPIRREHKLPALAAAVVEDGRTAALGAVGVRRAGGKESVAIDDRFHIGSCTKSMTATLCAILVQQGKLKWESTIGEVFADQRDKIHADFHAVTLEQLLTHRSGLPDDTTPDWTIWPKVRLLSGPIIEQRRKLVELVLVQKPAAAPGTKHQYSNYGYTIAGAMCERATGKSWEDLMRAELFTPLGMTTASFGPPGNAKAVDQPWGHSTSIFGQKAIAPGPLADNPAVIGPAGTVHCSLGDWAKYAAFHLRGARGEEPRLPADVFQKMHTPASGDDENYAFGWIATDRDWAGGKALTHGGSNTMWFAVIWLAPQRNTAYMAATNVGSNTAFSACDTAIGKLIELSSLLGESGTTTPVPTSCGTT